MDDGVDVATEVDVGVAVEELVGVKELVAVKVGEAVAVLVAVGGGVAVEVWLAIGVEVGVDDRVLVGVFECVGVAVLVNAVVGSKVGVRVGVVVAVATDVGVLTAASKTILRTLPLSVSAMNRSPAAFVAKPEVGCSKAALAGPLSPSFPYVPVPATVVMIPVPPSTRRIRLFLLSPMKMLPSASTVTFHGSLSNALTAGPPSPLQPNVPVPATRRMMPSEVILRT